LLQKQLLGLLRSKLSLFKELKPISKDQVPVQEVQRSIDFHIPESPSEKLYRQHRLPNIVCKKMGFKAFLCGCLATFFSVHVFFTCFLLWRLNALKDDSQDDSMMYEFDSLMDDVADSR